MGKRRGTSANTPQKRQEPRQYVQAPERSDKPRKGLNKAQIEAISTYLQGLSGVAAAAGALNWWLMMFNGASTRVEASVLSGSALVLLFFGLWLLRTPNGGEQ